MFALFDIQDFIMRMQVNVFDYVSEFYKLQQCIGFLGTIINSHQFEQEKIIIPFFLAS